MKFILNQVVDNIITKQKTNILFFADYVITSNYDHDSELPVMILSSSRGELFYSTPNKDYMLYVIKRLYDMGRMFEPTFGKLYYEVSEGKSIAKLN